MKKILILSLVTFVSLALAAQERIIIEKDFQGNPLVYTESEVDYFEQPHITAFISLSGGRGAYFAADEAEMKFLREYLISVRDKLISWETERRRHGIKEIEREMIVPAYGFHLRWTQSKYPKFSWVKTKDELDEYDLGCISLQYKASRQGDGYVMIRIRPVDPDGVKGYAVGLFYVSKLNDLIKWCDYDRIMRAHAAKQPKYTEEQLKEIFK